MDLARIEPRYRDFGRRLLDRQVEASLRGDASGTQLLAETFQDFYQAATGGDSTEEPPLPAAPSLEDTPRPAWWRISPDDVLHVFRVAPDGTLGRHDQVPKYKVLRVIDALLARRLGGKCEIEALRNALRDDRFVHGGAHTNVHRDLSRGTLRWLHALGLLDKHAGTVTVPDDLRERALQAWTAASAHLG